MIKLHLTYMGNVYQYTVPSPLVLITNMAGMQIVRFADIYMHQVFKMEVVDKIDKEENDKLHRASSIC